MRATPLTETLAGGGAVLSCALKPLEVTRGHKMLGALGHILLHSLKSVGCHWSLVRSEVGGGGNQPFWYLGGAVNADPC